jgi:S1-C subfamily serine protease
MRRFTFLMYGLILLSSVVFAQEDDLSLFAKSYREALEKIEKSIVSIKVVRRREPPPRPVIPGIGMQVRRPRIPTSGVIVEEDGFILTSYFNVSGRIRRITVTLYDGRKYKAKLLGLNGRKDIALLKINAEDLPVPKKIDVNTLQVGQIVLAVGRNAKSKKLIVNPGVISALDRLWGGVQFDGRLNFGNVGGALIDLEGRLIGITCQINISPVLLWGQNSGVSFACRVDEIEQMLPLLKEGKRTGRGRPALLGIRWDSSADVEGVKVKEVIPRSAAERAGIKPGDIIIEFDGKRITRFDELYKATFMKDAGNRVKVKVLRGGKELEFDVRLGAREDLPRRRRPPRRPQEEE